MIIRFAQPSDIDQLLGLSSMLPPGMTSMPFDRPTWEKKLQLVQDSIARVAVEGEEDVYLLVLEDPSKNKIVGTVGVVAGVGYTQPFYNYRLSKDVKASKELGLMRSSNLLNLMNDYTGGTEMVSLFLLPEYRKNGVGQFLSRCRYLFMSDFPDRFGDIVFAEIRGWLDEDNQSPFWSALGQKFFNLPFHKADFISAVDGTQFISDLMPKFPVYLELLPQHAIDVIGKPHADAAPARALLEKEGFRYKGSIDVFDGGPVLECEREDIKSIKEVQQVTLVDISAEENSNGTQCIVSNGSLEDYRMALTRPIFDPADNSRISLPSSTLQQLGIKQDATVQLLELH